MFIVELVVETFKASFSSVSNSWHVDLDEIEFEVRNIKINGFDTKRKRLAATIRKITGTEVEFEWWKSIVILKKWKTLEKVKHHIELWDPDMPKNLAKSVTVR